MRSPTRLFALALTSWLSAGCAGGGGAGAGLDVQLGLPEGFSTTYRAEPVVHRSELTASVDQVLDVLPVVYQELGLPAVPDDGMAQTFTTPTLRIQGRLYEDERNSEYFRCGTTMSGERADQSELQFVARTRVRANDDGGSLVETVVGARSQDRYSSTDAVACRSTGKLEEEIERRLQRKTLT